MASILSCAYLLSEGPANLLLPMLSEGHREWCSGSQSGWAVQAPSRTPMQCPPQSVSLSPPEEEMMGLKHTRAGAGKIIFYSNIILEYNELFIYLKYYINSVQII